MKLRVRPWFYRLLWISVAVIGAICTLGFLPLLLGDQGAIVVHSDKSLLLAGAVFGLIILVYAVWRLRWPLKAQPRE